MDVVVGQIAAGPATRCSPTAGSTAHEILGVGVGVPGIIEQGPEVLVHGQTYGWDAVPLERLLRAHTDLPAEVPLHFDNGAKTMGQAELWFGAGRGARNAVVVLIGSGVGASLISGGATYQGATSSAAEFGHVTVVVGGRKCRCGSTGCLEAYAGAEAILERYGRPMAADDQELALAELIDAAGTSPLAAAILDETAQYLGAGIGTLINLFNPERVILGGWAGLLLGGRLLPEIRECGAAAFAAPPVRRHLDRARAARSRGGRARRGDASDGVLPQRGRAAGPAARRRLSPGHRSPCDHVAGACCRGHGHELAFTWNSHRE